MEAVVRESRLAVPERLKILNANQLKMIAVASMLIDHIAGGILWHVLDAMLPFDLSLPYMVMRGFGRIAFPIFCFFLVEGLHYTRNRTKYLLHMFEFALISEVPFDICFFARPVQTSSQNVYFTLALGLAMMMALEWEKENLNAPEWARIAATALTVAGACALAIVLRTDYAAKGIIFIYLLYAFRNERIAQAIVGGSSLLWEPWALAAFPPLLMYNGERGNQNKKFYYWFYPAHLLAIAIVAALLYQCI